MLCSGPITMKTKNGNIKCRCKQCLPCRITTQSGIMLQCLLENQIASSAWFLTLTFREPPEIEDYSHFSMFLDRLRVRNRRAGNSLPIRYLGIGEYGTQSKRFHYHALIWNSMDFPTQVWERNLWPHGFIKIGNVSPASIRYTTNYTTKFLEEDSQALPKGRSTKPPLGEEVMQFLGTKARINNLNLPHAPTHLNHTGRTYSVNNAMKIAFMMGYDPQQVITDAVGTRSLARSSLIAPMEYELLSKFGDEHAEQRFAGEAKAISQARMKKNGRAL